MTQGKTFYPVIDKELRSTRNSYLCLLVKKRDKYICQVCGFKGNEAHHIHPIYLGGADEMNNMVCLCKDCHKHAPNQPDKFLAYQKAGGRRRMMVYGAAILELRKNPSLDLKEGLEITDRVYASLCEMSLMDEND